MAAIRTDLRRAGGGELQGHDLQHRPSLRHVAVRHPQHRLLQVEDEQGPRLHHVLALLRLRRSELGARVRIPTLP